MKKLELDYDKIDLLKTTLTDNNYVEAMWHRFFTGEVGVVNDNPEWQYPEDWLSRYHLYFEQYGHLLKWATVLDIGAGMNFYGVWAAINGARYVDYIEPDEHKYNCGIEYL